MRGCLGAEDFHVVVAQELVTEEVFVGENRGEGVDGLLFNPLPTILLVQDVSQGLVLVV